MTMMCAMPSAMHRLSCLPLSLLARRVRLLPAPAVTTLPRCRHSSTAADAAADSSFEGDALFPPPTDGNFHRHGMPLLARAAHHARTGRVLAYDRYASGSGRDAHEKGKKMAYSYREVLAMSSHLHTFIISQKKRSNSSADNDTGEAPRRIAFLCHPGPLYIATQFACWSSGSIAVPLCTSHKSSELAYVLKDCDPSFVIDGTTNLKEGRELRLAARKANAMDRYWCLDDVMADFSLPDDAPGEHAQQTEAGDDIGCEYALGANGEIPSRDHPALIIYTSGTTGNPKGVVHTHRNLYHQVTDLVTSWGWTSEDSILHFLPLHHVHGVINKLACPIWVGASVEFVRFNPVRIWERLARASRRWKGPSPADEADAAAGDNGNAANEENAVARREPTVFMAVPTIYAKMLEVAPDLPTTLDPSEVTRKSPIRLMVSGSAALPAGVFNRWKNLTGHTILERYGMSEFAMALSNPLEPVERRLPGYVGLPLPSVEAKIVDEDTGDVIPNGTDPNETPRSGELCVRGPTVFSEYWRKPHATAESFDFDGFFKTGDVAEYDPAEGSYHILGRVSADIIKCAGHKLSSLQIERTLLEHPSVVEAVVLGVPDETYGERVGLICRPRPGESIDLKELRGWCEERMAGYKIPSRMIAMTNDIPKNAMGKVSKKQLVGLFEDEERVQTSN